MNRGNTFSKVLLAVCVTVLLGGMTAIAADLDAMRVKVADATAAVERAEATGDAALAAEARAALEQAEALLAEASGVGADALGADAMAAISEVVDMLTQQAVLFAEASELTAAGDTENAEAARLQAVALAPYTSAAADKAFALIASVKAGEATDESIADAVVAIRSDLAAADIALAEAGGGAFISEDAQNATGAGVTEGGEDVTGAGIGEGGGAGFGGGGGAPGFAGTGLVDTGGNTGGGGGAAPAATNAILPGFAASGG